MTRYAFQGVLTDSAGDVVVTATVKVYDAGTSNYSDIYTQKTGGSVIDQDVSPVTTDGDGRWKFFVDDADYPFLSEFKIEFSKAGFTTTTYDDVR